jgi:hypothetical protein
MVRAYAEHCSRKYNVLLNKRPVHDVLEMTERLRDNHKLKEAAKKAAAFLKGR